MFPKWNHMNYKSSNCSSDKLVFGIVNNTSMITMESPLLYIVEPYNKERKNFCE